MYIDIALDKAYALLTGGPTVLVSSRNAQGRDNVMTNAWNTVYQMAPSQVLIVLEAHHDTTANVLSSGEFGLSIPGDTLKDGLLKAGMKHLRDLSPECEDKFAWAGLQKRPAQVVNLSLVDGALGYLECRLIDRELFATRGIALAEVVAAQVDNAYWDGSSIVCRAGQEQTWHSAGAYSCFPRGPVQAWFSRREEK